MTWYMELGGVDKHSTYFTRNKEVNCDTENVQEAINRFRDKCNNTDVYYCTYYYDNNTNRNDAQLYSDVYFDIDGDTSDDDGYCLLQDMTKKLLCVLKSKLLLNDGDINIYFSGCKGFHLIIPSAILGISPNKNLNIIYKELTLYMKRLLKDDSFIDSRIYDSKRLMRMVNSVNSKTGLYKVQISEKQLYSFNRDAMLEYASIARDIIHSTSPLTARKESAEAFKALYYSGYNERIAAEKERNKKHRTKASNISQEKIKPLPCVINLLKTSAEQGYRNNTMILIASGLINSNYQYEETVAILMDWNSYNNPPLPDREIIAGVKSIIKMKADNRYYGCSSFRDMGACDNSCPIAHKKVT